MSNPLEASLYGSSGMYFWYEPVSLIRPILQVMELATLVYSASTNVMQARFFTLTHLYLTSPSSGPTLHLTPVNTWTVL